MYSGHIALDADEDGYFIDCDAESFGDVLGYLRDEKVPPMGTKKANKLIREVPSLLLLTMVLVWVITYLSPWCHPGVSGTNW